MKSILLHALLAARFEPDPQSGKPRARLRYASLARAFKVPQSTVRDACVKFERSMHSYKNFNDLLTYVKSISLERKCNQVKFQLEEKHLRFLTSQKTLSAWATRSLAERTVLFHRIFPEKFIKRWRLREVYR